MGPAAMDLATLLYSPEADLTDAEIDDLVAHYHDLLPATTPGALLIHRQALEASAIVKMLFYAGSAANFYRRFDESHRLATVDWYLTKTMALLEQTPAYQDLATLLGQCCRASRDARTVVGDRG